jgi:sacsin
MPAALLFLKSVRSVEVWVRGSHAPPAAAAGSPPHDSAADSSSQLLFRASSAAADGGDAPSPQAPILQFIAGTSAAAAAASSGEVGTSAVPASLDGFFKRLAAASPEQLPRHCTTVRLTRDERPASSSSSSISSLPGEDSAVARSPLQQLGRAVDETWLVANMLAGGTARKLALSAWNERGTKMVPWAGVAARLPTSEQDSGDSGSDSPPSARPFCFLPLPGTTGLPCTVNGLFELSSNRCAASWAQGAGGCPMHWAQCMHGG